MEPNTQEAFEAYDRYLMNEMSPEERDDFLKVLNDTSLKEDFELFQLSIKSIDVSQTRLAAEKAFHRYKERNVSTFSFAGWGMRIAASVIFLFLMSVVFYTVSIDNESFVSELGTPYILPVTRSAAESFTSLESEYLEDNYTEVVAIFDDLEIRSSTDYFLSAMSYLSLKNYNEASNLLERLKDINELNETNYFQQETDYYLTVAYVGEGRYDEAIELMLLIRNDPNHLFNQNIRTKDLMKARLLRLF